MSPRGPTTTSRPPDAPARPAASERRPGGRGRAIDPRISARRKAVIRQQGRRRLRTLTIGLMCTAAVIGAWYLLHSPLFSARSVTVVGAAHETAAQVKAASGLSSRTPLMDVDRGAVSARIEQLPWVKSAAVAVSWPDGVKITVTEETPLVAVPEPGGRWATVSADGRVLEVTATRPAGLRSLSVPQVPGAPGSILPTRDGVGLLVASTLPPSFAGAGDGSHGRTGRLGAVVDDDADRREHRVWDPARGEVRRRLLDPGRCVVAERRRDRRQRATGADGDPGGRVRVTSVCLTCPNTPRMVEVHVA